MKYQNRLLSIVCCLMTAVSVSATPQKNVKITYHVKPQFEGERSGSVSNPFAHLSEARDAIRKQRRSQAADTFYQYNVFIHEGTYAVTDGLLFETQDGGDSSTEIIYQGVGETAPVFFGGKTIPNQKIEALKDPYFKERLINKSVSKHIKQVDLKALGIHEYGSLVRHGWGLNGIQRTPPVSLTTGGQRMHLARWPNVEEDSQYMVKQHYLKEPRPLKGYEKKVQKIIESVELTGEVGLTKVIDSGGRARKSPRSDGGTFQVGFDRMKYWNSPENIFLDGVLGSTWEWTYNQLSSVDPVTKTISLKYPELNGIALGNSVRLPHFHFDNIPEELDSPGEYFIDRNRGILFFYPIQPDADEATVIVTLDQPMLTVSNSRNITFKNIVFESGRNLGIKISQSHNIQLERVKVSNFIAGGIEVKGTNNRVIYSTVVGSGAFGIYLDGGNKKTLMPANNYVLYSHIHDFGWDVKSQQPGVFINGVGNHVVNNKIHDGTHFAIRVRAANDSIIERNEIYDLPKYHHFDGGALYVHSGRFPQARGVIIRENYFHDIPTNGIYPDNFSWGVHMYRNVFYNVGVKANRSAIFVNGGGENHSYNNLVIDSNEIYRQGTRPKDAYWLPYWKKVKERYGNGRVNRTAYRKYNDFKQWLEKETQEELYRPRSDVYNNVIVSIDQSIGREARATGVVDKSGHLFHQNNIVINNDPHFYDWENKDFRLKESSPIFQQLPEFEPIPFEKIGLTSQ